MFELKHSPKRLARNVIHEPCRSEGRCLDCGHDFRRAMTQRVVTSEKGGRGSVVTGVLVALGHSTRTRQHRKTGRRSVGSSSGKENPKNANPERRTKTQDKDRPL